MLQEVKISGKADYAKDLLNRQGAQNYRVYKYQHLTIAAYQKPSNRAGELKYHITVTSDKRYGAARNELRMIAEELLPKGSKYKIKTSLFMKGFSHIYQK